MKILSLLLSLCISFNVLAATGTVSGLERAIDDFQYTMTVEWDQKDQKFHDAQTDLFLKKLSEIIKKEGLTKDQVIAMAEKRVQDKQAFEAMKLKMTLLNKNASAEELAVTLKETSKEFYSKGASWNGDAALIIPLALFAIVIGYAVWWSATHECVAREDQWQCDTTEYCADYDTDWDGNSYCSWWEEDTDCGYVSVCTQWQKKK